jgi:L-cysteine:1D-myo-inositol 2-amino-2-deoxy-alpha-D-glucopyranoside ligase
MTALRMLPPKHYIGAVESIPGIVPLVERLGDAGAAYDSRATSTSPSSPTPPSARLQPRRASRCGCCPPSAAATRTARARRTRSTRCCGAAAREGEPSWDGGSLGRGRPGWHIECVAIALDHLGMGFDVQGGGSDLAFPHHEMGASHAQVLTGEFPIAKAYVHAGMVGLTARRCRSPRATWSSSPRCAATASTRPPSGSPCSPTTTAPTGSGPTACWRTPSPGSGRWRAAVSRPDGPSADALVEEMREALANDLDAPAALAAVDRWAASSRDRGGTDEGAPGVVSRAVDALLGVAL